MARGLDILAKGILWGAALAMLYGWLVVWPRLIDASEGQDMAYRLANGYRP